MPLIKCPDCSREISDQAPSCIGCGRPMAVARTESGDAWVPPMIPGCPKCGMPLKQSTYREGGGAGFGTVMVIAGIPAIFVHWVAGAVLMGLGFILFAVPGVVVRVEDCTGRRCMYRKRLGTG